ncbi:MAG: hypothetical protein M1826_002510 [Phylliscum demangeonii]|nr:MAG: hypothetical protein M1826_002510 [Phylliscum demangeonii]
MAPSSVSKAKSDPKKPASKAPVKVTKTTPKTTPTKTMPKVTPSKTIRATPIKSETTPAKALTLATPVKKLNVVKAAKTPTAKSATKVSAPTEEIESAAVKMWRNQEELCMAKLELTRLRSSFQEVGRTLASEREELYCWRARVGELERVIGFMRGAGQQKEEELPSLGKEPAALRGLVATPNPETAILRTRRNA